MTLRDFACLFFGHKYRGWFRYKRCQRCGRVEF